MYKRGLWWIKRDFRLSDNVALTRALELCDEVLPVLILEPSVVNSPDFSPKHLRAIEQAAHQLRSSLTERGSELLLLQDEAPRAFATVKEIFDFEAVFSYEETGLEITYARDRRMSTWFKQKQVIWEELPRGGVVRRLPTRDGRNKIWYQRIYAPMKPQPQQVPLNCAAKEACHLADWSTPFRTSEQNATLQTVSEVAAQTTLKTFLDERALGYSGGISSPNTAFHSGSRLSAHLAWGTISLRDVYQTTSSFQQELQQVRPEGYSQWSRSLRSFKSRLHWHDHFIQRLETEPEMEFNALNRCFCDLSYTNDEQRLTAWLTGRTGSPMVDACMRCLNKTGFLNFRMRAMVVSYACHALHLSWKDIMHPLAQLFLDYEPGIHVSQLQMQAGVMGINTIRVYSPHKQMLDHDPKFSFVRTWLPELSNVTDAQLKNGSDAGVEGYLDPVCDYKTQTTEMKRMLYSIKRSAEGREEAQRVMDKHGSRKSSSSTRRSSSKTTKG